MPGQASYRGWQDWGLGEMGEWGGAYGTNG